jgi:hypothetical protein
LRLEIPADPRQQTKDDQEVLVNTQDIMEMLREQGREEGRAEGFAEALLTAYEARFGAPGPEIVAAIQGTHDRATFKAWLKLVTTRPADEVASALRASRSS